MGITYHANRPVSHILFWCSNDAQDYVITKPLHGSQIQYHGEEEKRLHAQYSSLEGGSFFSIDCIENFELITLLCSYGQNLIVLEPTSVRDEVFNRISVMVDKYMSMRK